MRVVFKYFSSLLDRMLSAARNVLRIRKSRVATATTKTEQNRGGTLQRIPLSLSPKTLSGISAHHGASSGDKDLDQAVTVIATSRDRAEMLDGGDGAIPSENWAEESRDAKELLSRRQEQVCELQDDSAQTPGAIEAEGPAQADRGPSVVAQVVESAPASNTGGGRTDAPISEERPEAAFKERVRELQDNSAQTSGAIEAEPAQADRGASVVTQVIESAPASNTGGELLDAPIPEERPEAAFMEQVCELQDGGAQTSGAIEAGGPNEADQGASVVAQVVESVPASKAGGERLDAPMQEERPEGGAFILEPTQANTDEFAVHDQEHPDSHVFAGMQQFGVEIKPDTTVNEVLENDESDEVYARVSGKSGRLTRPKARPSEDTGEYVDGSVKLSPLPDAYSIWNEAIAHHMLLADHSGDVYLTITPRSLAHVIDDCRSRSLSPEDAELSFVSATSEMYRRRVLNQSAKLRTLRRLGNNGIPECVGFLALSVLAAYRMRADEDAAGHAYYVRLANLLSCDFSGNYPGGFDPAVFESLWSFVKSWLENRTGTKLVLPQREESAHYRYVAFPLAHVPLRCLDVEKLPDLFVWAGYQPGSSVPSERLQSDLLHWERSRCTLTPIGAAALKDERRSAVVAQVESELQSWDGSVIESTNRRTALVEVSLDVVLRRPALFYIPRRPAGFPEIFQSGNRLFEAAERGWYDPAEISSDDGSLLADGFEWPSSNGDVENVLRRPGARAIAFTPSEYSGFLSHRSLNLGVKCAVLCSSTLTRMVTDYLESVSRQRCSMMADPALPKGWSLFTNVVPVERIEVPAGLEPLDVDSSCEVVASGGLRIGRKWSWLAGAPPQIYVSGLVQSEQPMLNGEPVPVSGDGLIQLDARLSCSGTYFLEVGRLRKRIEIIEPQFSEIEQSRCYEFESNSLVVLPAGAWTLIGAEPGEIGYGRSERRSGTFVKSPFTPVWAIQVGGGRGATVGRLSRLEPRMQRANSSVGSLPHGMHRLEQWVDAIYSAHVRRPNFIQLVGIDSDESTLSLWKQYVLMAKSLKRLIKRH